MILATIVSIIELLIIWGAISSILAFNRYWKSLKYEWVAYNGIGNAWLDIFFFPFILLSMCLFVLPVSIVICCIAGLFVELGELFMGKDFLK